MTIYEYLLLYIIIEGHSNLDRVGRDVATTFLIVGAAIPTHLKGFRHVSGVAQSSSPSVDP